MFIYFFSYFNFFFFLKHSLCMQLKLAPNSPCSYPQLVESGIPGVCHHVQLA